MSRPSPTPIYTLRGSDGPLNTLYFSCHGGDIPILISGTGKGTIDVWNLDNRRIEKKIHGHSGSSVIWVSMLERTVITQGRDMQVCIWDLSEGRATLVQSVLTGNDGFCQCSMLETSPSNYMLAFPVQQTDQVKVITLPCETLVGTLIPKAKLGMVMCIKLWQPDSGTGPLLFAGYECGILLLWDVNKKSKLSQLRLHSEPIMCMTFDSTQLRGIAGCSERRLTPWMVDEKKTLQMHDCVMLVNPGVSQLCLRDDAKLLLSAGWDHRVRVFSWKKLQPLAVLQYHTDVVLSVAFSDHQDLSQRLVAAGSKDQRISLWSIYSEAAETV